MPRAEAGDDVWELLRGRDDDLLARLDRRAQVGRRVGMHNGAGDLREALDGVVDLAVEDDAVGDNDDRVTIYEMVTTRTLHGAAEDYCVDDEVYAKHYDEYSIGSLRRGWGLYVYPAQEVCMYPRSQTPPPRPFYVFSGVFFK